jgi:hypothetical protein
VNRDAGMVDASFARYLAGQAELVATPLDTYLEAGRAARFTTLDAFVKRGRLTVGPGELVYRARTAPIIFEARGRR